MIRKKIKFDNVTKENIRKKIAYKFLIIHTEY